MFQSKTTSDSRVVLAVLKGKRDEFGVLVRRYLPAVHAVAYARLGNASDADDVAQDVFVRAFQRLETLRDRRKFGPWLMTIARNTAMQLLRSRAREAKIVAELPSPPPSVDPDVEQRELRETLHRAILQLDPEQRELLLLRYFSGLSIRELATLLEITPNAAKKRVQRARETLGQQMFDRIEKGEGPQEREDQVKRIMGAVLALPAPAKAAAAAGVTALVVKLVTGSAAALIVGTGALYLANTEDEDVSTFVTEIRPLEVGVVEPLSPSAVSTVGNETPLRDTTAIAQTDIDVALDAATGSITGRVYDSETDEALAGLELTLHREGQGTGQENSERFVKTDENGAYRLSDLPPGTYRFQQPKLNHYPYGELDELVDVLAGETRTYDLTLRNAGVAIAGVIKDEHGTPLSGVRVGGMTNQENRWHNAESASDGRFRIVGFGSGGTGFEITASKEGYAMPALQGLTVPPSGLRGVELVMYEEATLSGTVVDPDGKPVQSVWVAAWPLTGSDGPICKVETQQDGSFTISSLFPGEHRIVFGSPDGNSWTIRNEVARIALEAAEKRAGLVLVNAPDGEYQISGRVVDSDGGPVLAANLSIHQPVFRSAQSDEDGSFTIEELPEGSYTIEVNDYGSAMWRTRSIPDVIAGTTDLEIVLETQATVRGVVVDETNGAPIKQFDLNPESGLLDQIDGHITWGYRPHSGPEGRFELKGVGPGDITVFVRAEGYAQAIHHVTDLTKGEMRDGIRIVISKGVVIEGRVVNLLYQPVQGALVYIGPIPEQQMRTQAAVAETDAKGRFTVHVAAGDGQVLSAYHTSYAPAETEVRLTGTEISGVEIVLPNGGTIEGAVSRGAEPVSNEAVVLQVNGVHMGSVNTNGQGVFRFEHVPPGEGSLKALLQEGSSELRTMKREFAISSTETLTVNLATNAGMGTLTGQLTRKVQPTTVQRIELSALQASGAIFEYKVQTGSEGSFQFDRVPAGTAMLEIVEYDGDETFVLYYASLNIPDGGTVVHDIALEE